MTRIAIDPALQEKLTASAELCDASGRTLGVFLTAEEHEWLRKVAEEAKRRDYEWAVADVSDEELDAAEAEDGEYTHEQVMDFLRELEALERAKLP